MHASRAGLLRALMAGVLMFGIRRGDEPEPPPREYANKGLAPGYTLTRLDSPEAVDRFCRAWGVAANDTYVQRQIQACVVNPLKAVVMPPEGALRKGLDGLIEAHEAAHTWGLKHRPDGTHWDGAAPPRPANLFANAPDPPMTGNIFHGR